jgi:shikimate dehydrogenase
MNLSGKTAVYGVIGDPIVHTLSPAMQNAAFEAYGLDAVFLAFNVPAGEAESAVRGVRALGMPGLNITMPHKEVVLPFLDEADETARALGSVNTILNQDGRLRGFNTDGAGAHHALEESGVILAGKKLVLLGAGGAAKAVAYALAREVAELVILNRTAQKADALAKTISEKFHKKIATGSFSPDTIQKSLREADILINATAVGMCPRPKESLVKKAWLKPDLTVLDIVYDPVETQLAKDAKAAGAQVVNGLEMLLHQGAASFEIWTGKAAPVVAMRQALLKQLR